MQRNSKPIAWRPKGVSDTLDASTAFSGAMAALTNLVPDPTTSELWQCRPACTLGADLSISNSFSSGFSSGFGALFSNPGFISTCKVFGNIVYGMVATTRNVGFDEPFSFNLLTNNFVLVNNVLATNVPASPSSVGAWTPPQMTLIGKYLVVTHPGFNGSFGAFFGYFDVSDPTTPVWNGANCVGANFPTFTVPPSGVAQFNGRAYFLHNLTAQPAVIISDSLNPTSNSSGAFVPILTFDDNQTLTAIGGLPLSSPITGGIIQAVMVFKGGAIYQITGDPSTNNLTRNSLNVPTGTYAPATVTPTPKGLSFISPQGLRIIGFDANVSDPIGQRGQGVTVPFIYANVPSRMVSAANGSIIRITTQNAFIAGTSNQEWWCHLAEDGIWTGPHTSAMSSLSPWQDTFVGVLVGVNNKFWKSDYRQSVTSTFVENSVQLKWTYQTSFLPDTDQMTSNTISQGTLDLQLTSGMTTPVTINMSDQNGIILDSVQVSAPSGAPLWGSATWGAFTWGGTQSALAPRILPWHKKVAFVRAQWTASGASANNFKIGAWHLRYQVQRQLVDITSVQLKQFTLDQSALGGPDVLG